MAHTEQAIFCKKVKALYPEMFSNKLILDVGSLDVNGNNQYLFEQSMYFGIDIAPGKNVDFICKGHEFALPDQSFDTIISTECFEHDIFYKKTIQNIYRLLKPGGLFLFTCATTGRPEHGTRRSRMQDAPLLAGFEDWGDYYKNLTEEDIAQCLDLKESFSQYEFSVDTYACDLYFWGFKKGTLEVRDDYSFLSESGVFKRQERLLAEVQLLKKDLAEKNEEVKQIRKEKETILNSRSWMLTKPLRAMADQIKKVRG